MHHNFLKSIWENLKEPQRRHIAMAGSIIAIILINWLIYSNTHTAGFQFDDHPYILNDRAIRMTEINWSTIHRAAFESEPKDRPIPNISFALNYYIGKYSASGYHLANIVIHIFTGIFLFFFLKTTLIIQPDRSALLGPSFIALTATLLWSVIPVNTQAVTYIVQRMTSMVAMFYILSLCLYSIGRVAWNKKQYAIASLYFFGCLISGLFAIASKENAATLPLIIFLYEWFFFQDKKFQLSLKKIAWGTFFGIIFVALVFYFTNGDPLQRILNSYARRDFTLPERLMTEFRVVVYYISLLIYPFPSRLNLDHQYPLSQGLLHPLTTFFALAAIICLIWTAIRSAERERLTSFCILWFLITLVIESSIIGIEIIFDHRTYLPSMLLSLLFVMGLFRLIRHAPIALSILCVLILTFSFLAYKRNTIWNDELVLWQDCISKSPQKFRVHNNLGFALYNQGQTEKAIHHYLEALRINPYFAQAHNNLGVALDKQHRFEEAIQHFLQAIEIKPNYFEAYKNMGATLDQQGLTAKAMEHYRHALQINPDYAEAHINLGLALEKMGHIKEGFEHYSHALRIDPDNVEALTNSGVILDKNGRTEEAIKNYLKALKIKPDNAEALTNLGVALDKQGHTEEAIDHHLSALRIKPDYEKAHNNLGIALFRKGDIKGAIAQFQEAIKINPNYINAKQNLNHALAAQQQQNR